MAGFDGTIRFEMLVSVDRDTARTGAVLCDWLRIGLDVFGGGLGAAAWRRALPPGAATQIEGPDGGPDEVSVDLVRERGNGEAGFRTRPLSVANWNEFLAEAAELPDHATIRLRPGGSGAPGMVVNGSIKHADDLREVALAPVGGDWLQLTTLLPVNWLADESYTQRLTDAWREVAQRCDPAYGEVAGGEGEMTELEMHLPGLFRMARRNIPQSRHRLRGYGWVTICPQELGEELGGERYLVDSGAFSRVVSLAAGGYWLQATPRYPSYDPAAARRVFDTLAPVLIPGEPSATPPFGPSPHIVYEHPRPGEPVEATKPERGYTRGRPVDRGTLPTYILVATGEQTNLIGSTEWGWELLRDGVVCHNWRHNKPNGDRFVKILAELVISQNDNGPVHAWTPERSNDGNVRYRAILGEIAT